MDWAETNIVRSSMSWGGCRRAGLHLSLWETGELSQIALSQPPSPPNWSIAESAAGVHSASWLATGAACDWIRSRYIIPHILSRYSLHFGTDNDHGDFANYQNLAIQARCKMVPFASFVETFPVKVVLANREFRSNVVWEGAAAQAVLCLCTIIRTEPENLLEV